MSPTGGTAPDGGFPEKLPSAFPWDDALALGLGRLGWRPRDFWAATPRELMAAAGLARPGQAAGRADLARLLAAHPDTA